MMGGAAGGSGSGGGSTANVFAPPNQGTAAADFWSTIQPLIDASAGGGAGTPGGWAYPKAQSAWSDFLSPYTGRATGALDSAQQGADYYRGTAFPQITGAASNLLTTSADPESLLYKREQQNVTDMANAQNAMSGTAGTPYATAGTERSLNNFDINWQDKLLGREAAGLQAAAPALQNASSAVGTIGAMPYNFGAQIGQNALSGLGSTTNLGNNQYLLPQQVLQDLESYLGLGQSASTISGQLGNLGVSQLGSALGGLGSLAGGANNLFGGSSGGGGLLSSLFGGGGGAGLETAGFGGGADLGALAGETAGIGGGSDLAAMLPLAASA